MYHKLTQVHSLVNFCEFMNLCNIITVLFQNISIIHYFCPFVISPHSHPLSQVTIDLLFVYIVLPFLEISHKWNYILYKHLSLSFSLSIIFLKLICVVADISSFFLLLTTSISLYGYTILCSTTHQLMGVRIVSSLGHF